MADHTPGPWEWRGYPGRLRLSASGNTVMDFERRGMQGAGPRFNTDGLMDSADDFVRFEVAPDVVGLQAGKSSERVYRMDVCGVAHSDAALIAAAPDLLLALRLVLNSTLLETDGHDWRACDQPSCRLACEAIAKATGEVS